MISLHYLLFISLIPITITIEHKIKFVFLNGFNIIRCSENQVQVYTAPEATADSFYDLMACDNKDDIFEFPCTGLVWDELNFICPSSDQVHEVQFVTRKFHRIHGLDILPAAKGELAASKQPYKLYIVDKDPDDYGKYFAIQSDDQPLDDAFFDGENKRRTIYVQFPGHPIICRLLFSGEKNQLCSSESNEEPVESDYVCYYNPSAEVEPTAAELEAEMAQVMKHETGSNSDKSVLNLKKPVISTTDLSDSTNKIVPNILPNDHPAKVDKKAKTNAASSSKNQKKSSAGKIIGIVLGALVLLALIGGVAFYFIQKNRSNQSSLAKSSSAVSNETGNNKGSATSGSNQSEESSAADSNNEIPTNDRIAEGKPNVELQTSPANKRQRPGANLAFNDDV